MNKRICDMSEDELIRVITGGNANLVDATAEECKQTQQAKMSKEYARAYHTADHIGCIVRGCLETLVDETVDQAIAKYKVELTEKTEGLFNELIMASAVVEIVELLRNIGSDVIALINEDDK